MTDQDTRNNSPDLSDLNRKARSGEISIDSFFDDLERLGITDFRQAMYASLAFCISLGDAKLAFIKRQPGGVEAWERQFEEINFEALIEDLE